jgi:dihydrodipicolinate synthase/N-acetylneuraminate lyase
MDSHPDGDQLMTSVQGMIVPLVTPLKGRGEVDVGALKALCEIQIESGIQILFLLGTTGEFYGLSPQQRREVVDTTVQTVRGRVPVIVGISGDSTASALAALDSTRHGGVSAYVISTPYFLSYSQSELLDYFRELADAVGAAVILYNYPARYGHVIEVDTIETLVKEGRVFAIKDTAGDLEYMFRLLQLKSSQPSFRVFEGALQNLALSGRRGIDGSVQAIGNLLPAECARLWSLIKSQEWTILERETTRMWQFHRDIEGVAIFIAALKGCMELRGWCNALPAKPTQVVGDPAREHLRKLMQSAYPEWAVPPA